MTARRGRPSGGSLTIGTAALAAGAKSLTAGKCLPEGPVTLCGPHHLLASPTQSVENSRDIVESGELWGMAPRWGGNATARAHRGRTPSREA